MANLLAADREACPGYDREACPGYDRDLRMCLIRPGDCEFNPADGEAVLVVETPEALTRDGSVEVGSR